MRTRSLKKNKINVVTLGCSKNVYDSEILMGQLRANDKDVVHEEEGNIVVINTCGFIDSAVEESLEAIGEALAGIGTAGEWTITTKTEPVPPRSAVAPPAPNTVTCATAATGAPLLAADPHRLLEWPGIYQQIGLRCPDHFVVRTSSAGRPRENGLSTGSVKYTGTSIRTPNPNPSRAMLRVHTM